MPGEYEQLVEDLREELGDEWADKFAQHSSSSLRQRVGQTATLEKELAEAKAELKKAQDAPVRRDALRRAGVDFDALRPAEREAIEKTEAEKYDEEWAKGIVEKYELPVGERQEEQGEQPPAAAFGTPAGPTGNGGNTGVSSRSVLTPEEVSKWPFDKWVRFEDYCTKNGLDAAERLLQGEKVTGVTFS